MKVGNREELPAIRMLNKTFPNGKRRLGAWKKHKMVLERSPSSYLCIFLMAVTMSGPSHCAVLPPYIVWVLRVLADNILLANGKRGNHSFFRPYIWP